MGTACVFVAEQGRACWLVGPVCHAPRFGRLGGLGVVLILVLKVRPTDARKLSPSRNDGVDGLPKTRQGGRPHRPRRISLLAK